MAQNWTIAVGRLAPPPLACMCPPLAPHTTSVRLLHRLCILRGKCGRTVSKEWDFWYKNSGGILLRIIGGGCVARFSTSWPYFRPKHVIFHTRFKTWPLKYIPVFKPGGSHKTQHTCLRTQKLDHHYWDESANKKKIFLKIYFEFAHYGVMLFTSWEVRIVRNCARGLEYRPRP